MSEPLNNMVGRTTIDCSSDTEVFQELETRSSRASIELKTDDTPFRRQAILRSSDAQSKFRWRPGERLEQLIEHSCNRFANTLAVKTDQSCLTYRELNARSNQVARYLIGQGIQPGDRIGLLFDKNIETYVAMLGVLKARACYVPMDPAFPSGRLNFIGSDASLRVILSMSALANKLEQITEVPHVCLDAIRSAIDAQSSEPIGNHELAQSPDQACYIIYTSGTTGNPKGVIIEHASICNFIRVAGECYGFASGDRIYQGMTIAFDFSIEETWVPLLVGATLVPGIPGRNLVGEELGDFLYKNEINCLCCCPTLLSTIERDLPNIRVLLVGGEACPDHLVARWSQKGRTILNSYGPTEATVTAMLTELVPEKPVTIGKPLPTYSIALLDPEKDRVVQAGDIGEIGIAGIGLARGYLNRDQLTRDKFIPDFLSLPNNPSGRIYRTGDLGRLNGDDEIEYLGRIDSQVKIRGYRIELSEIESVLMEFPQVNQAVVTTYEPEAGMVELVAYYTSSGGALSREDMARELRSKLPIYMVPAYFEELDSIPMTVSNKADVKSLPKPQQPRIVFGGSLVSPETETEQFLANTLAGILSVQGVSVEDHFFEDLGANSLLMARFCTKTRQNPGLANVSMQDIYTYPTIRKLSEYLDSCDAQEQSILRKGPDPYQSVSNLTYYSCGILQLITFLGYTLAVLWISSAGLVWTYAGTDSIIEHYVRSVAFASSLILGLTLVPIAAKWLLIGRWQRGTVTIWSLRYFRFWLVKTLIRTAPPAAFVGTPIFNAYLRWLGANIGRNTVIESRFVPVCTDLFAVGDNTVLRKDSVLLGYRAQAGVIETGAIRIGSGAFVGEASVLDIDASIGDGAQLGHASSLQSGQHIPDGKVYHGSPAIETEADYCQITADNGANWRSTLYVAFLIAGGLLIAAPLAIMIANYTYTLLFAASNSATTLASATIILTVSVILYLGGLALGLIWVWLIPRACQLFIRPNKVYPLFGLHYLLQRIISASSNSRMYNLLFGDSSMIVHYMRFVGWDLGRVEQTGSNFGTNQRHDNPFMCRIGSGTMVSDGISMINMHMSNSSFSVKQTTIGDRSYLGNDIHYPPDGKTGANCLLATKVLVPINGPVRENVGLLGSPSFEIPRMVDRDKDIIGAIDDEMRRARLREKNKHNAITVAMYLVSRLVFICLSTAIVYVTVQTYQESGVLALAAASVLVLCAAVGYFALIERLSLGFKRLQSQLVTIYDPEFWYHERHWKLSDSPIATWFAGTPFRSIILRLLGVKVGRRVYDGGSNITERTLTEIGDEANLNEACVLQAHSLEEGAFKSDFIRIGARCSVGPSAFVHYGVRMGRESVLDADSFLMKGETLDAGTGWRGNPARLHRDPNA